MDFLFYIDANLYKIITLYKDKTIFMQNLYFLLLFVSSLAFSQYEKRWEKVIVLEDNGKIKSAAAEVRKIYQKATSDKNESQIIKCFFYQSKYIGVLNESPKAKILNNLEAAIAKASVPTKSILNLVYAKCLETYFVANRFSIINRTSIDSAAASDFLTWTTSDFEKQIRLKYAKTLENESILKQTSLTTYETLFDIAEIERFRKKTMFDYIIHENIRYYNTKIENRRTTDQFLINTDRFVFSRSKEFVNLKSDFIKDSATRKVIRLYQKLEDYNSSPEIEFERMKFCHEVVVKSNDVFLEALTSLQKSNPDKLLVQDILLERAAIYQKTATKESLTNNNTIALQLLDSILEYKNRSNAHRKAILMQKQITSKNIAVRLEKNFSGDSRARAFINYKNVDRIDVKFYSITLTDFRNLQKYRINRDSLINIIISKNKIVASQSYTLVNEKNYFESTTEVLLPKLTTGLYLAYFETDGYAENVKAAATQTVTVSNLSLLVSEQNETKIYQVVDRETGKPIENCEIISDDFKIKTDKSGVATYANGYKNNFSIQNLIAIKDKDTLAPANSYAPNQNPYDRKNLENPVSKISLYTDRAIYRPGQTVYFKGIAIQKKNATTQVVANLLVNLIISNANGEEIKEMDVTTNEFGSFSGEFVLPKSGLNGRYEIEADEPENYENDKLYDKTTKKHSIWDATQFQNSGITFSVEEYKRPKFSVTFEPIKENYTFNQLVKVNGNAKAFAGNTIAGAKVVYRIKQTKYAYRNWNTEFDRESEDFFSGETTADDSGNFSVEFTPTYDEDVDDENATYKILADITDSNGETQSAETIINIGMKTLLLETTVADKIETDQKNQILFKSTNLNGQFTPITGEIQIYFLKNFDHKFKKRLFDNPEKETISKSDFEKLFPYETYREEQMNSLKGTLVYSKKVNTAIDKILPLDFISNYKSGFYRLVFSATDTNKNAIETTKTFSIYQSKDKNKLANELFTFEVLNADPKKDGFAKIRIHASVPDLYINCTGSYNQTFFYKESIHVKNYQADVQVPLDKLFRQSFNFGIETIFSNQYFYFDENITLREIIPQMTVGVETFRTKIEPGTPEKWSFRINESKFRDNTEILASMYDSSLDQFKISPWSNPAIEFYTYNHFSQKKPLGFETGNASFSNLNMLYPFYSFVEKQTEMMWFGFDFSLVNVLEAQNIYKKQLLKNSKKPSNAFAVSGIIGDGMLPLPGVNILVKGTNRGSQTDFDGFYEIDAVAGETLVFSYLGMKTKEVIINALRINITLEDDSSQLEGVVVTAMGIKKEKRSLGYATTTIIQEDDSILALNGKVAGVPIDSERAGENAKVIIRGYSSMTGQQEVLYIIDGVPMTQKQAEAIDPSQIISINILKGSSAVALYGSKASNGVIIFNTKKALEELTQVKARTNLNETAFFFPHLRTDAQGKFHFEFTSPEALTEWKMRLLAHNKNGVSGQLEKMVVTQKQLMVFPNMPRFLRENDTIVIHAKISNLTKETKSGLSILQFYDAVTMEQIDSKMYNDNNTRNFTAAGNGNATVSWKVFVPEGLQGVTYKVIAKSGDFSDGEENILPVLTNNMLVTESIPVWVRENSKKEYVFENFKNNSSSTLRNHKFTFEYTSNPTWIAIQSLPYLMEFEHECAEQTFARYYANVLATEIINSNPKISTVIQNWLQSGKSVSKLEQNDELKSLILAETPWVRDAESETEKKKKLALLLNLGQMKLNSESTFKKLQEKQNPSGGFSWFSGGHESEYITRHILSGLGHLNKMITDETMKNEFAKITQNGVLFTDSKFIEQHHYREIQNTSNRTQIVHDNLHYLYMRSFYLESNPLAPKLNEIILKHLAYLKQNWLNYSLYEKSMAALVLHRFKETETAKKILTSLKEMASNNEDWGMYWTANVSGWYWYQAPIETQALLIEAFSEIANDNKSVDAMKVWLIKNKQDRNWPTTKATTEAIYALLMQGTDWLSVKDNTKIKIGDHKILTAKLAENEKESETGYFKLNWNTAEITKDMATVSITNNSKVPAYGGIYWQYFEDLDKIKSAQKNIINVSKELYIKKNGSDGQQLERIASNNPLKVGQLVTVRLIINCLEDMEYVHLKDMRASCFEPVDVLSKYKWEFNLGYYQSTKDAATHFFFDKIDKGTYVLEYDIRVNNIGQFSNGITTIESMYAPEFTNHTKGIRIKVSE